MKKNKKTNKNNNTLTENNELITLADVQEFFMEELGLCFNGERYYLSNSTKAPRPATNFEDLKKSTYYFYTFDVEKSINKDVNDIIMTINEIDFKHYDDKENLVKDYSKEWRKFCYKKYNKAYIDCCIKSIEDVQRKLFDYNQREINGLKNQIKEIEEKRDRDLKFSEKVKKSFFKKTFKSYEVDDYQDILSDNSNTRIAYLKNIIENKKNELVEDIQKLEKMKDKIIALENDLIEAMTF